MKDTSSTMHSFEADQNHKFDQGYIKEIRLPLGGKTSNLFTSKRSDLSVWFS